ELGDDVGELGLDVLTCTRNDWKLCRLPAPVDLRRARAREKVESDVELPGDQITASELRAQPPFLDHGVDEGVALLDAPFNGFAGGRLLCSQPLDEPLGIGHDLHATSKSLRCRVSLETNLSDLTPRQPPERHPRAH